MEDSEYETLLRYLFDMPFIYINKLDCNRASDGECLRFSFSMACDIQIDQVLKELRRSCTMLEMMVALCLKCEEIMHDDDYGDRTGLWFAEMLNSLDLLRMKDEYFDLEYAREAIETFLNREYYSDGLGGLFYIPGTNKDMRSAEIWYQMLWYINYID